MILFANLEWEEHQVAIIQEIVSIATDNHLILVSIHLVVPMVPKRATIFPKPFACALRNDVAEFV